MVINIAYALSLFLGFVYIKKIVGKDFIKNKIGHDSLFLFFIVSLPIIGRYESLALFLLSLLLLLYKSRIVKDQLIIVYFLIVLIGTISIFKSIEIVASFRELLIITSYFLISISATTLIYQLKDVFAERTIKYIIISALTISCFSFIDLIGLFKFSDYIILLKTNNHLAYYIGIALIISIVLFYERRNDKSLYLIPIAICIISLLSTGSRGALVAFVVALGVFAILNNKYKTVLVMILIAIIGLVNFNKFPRDLQRTLLSIINKTATFSNLERIAIWSSSIDMIKSHPLTGVGIDNWRFYYLLPQYMRSVNEYPHAHNFYLQIGSEIGLIGLSLYISVFIISIYYSVYVIRKSKLNSRKDLVFSLLMSIIFTAIYGLFNNPLFNSKPAMLFYIIIGLNAGIYKLTRKEIKAYEKYENITN